MKPTAPSHPSVFARAIAFDVECPGCGNVDKIRDGGRRWRSGNFNPVSRRWFCQHCRRLWAVGLTVWPVALTGNRSHAQVPLDCQPKPDQLSALRHQYGLVRKTPHRRGDSVNLMGCPCLDREDVDPACPFHVGQE